MVSDQYFPSFFPGEKKKERAKGSTDRPLFVCLPSVRPSVRHSTRLIRPLFVIGRPAGSIDMSAPAAATPRPLSPSSCAASAPLPSFSSAFGTTMGYGGYPTPPHVHYYSGYNICGAAADLDVFSDSSSNSKLMFIFNLD